MKTLPLMLGAACLLAAACTPQDRFIVITGYALATTPICTRLISSACSKPNSPTGVYVYCVILSTIGYYLNWGFGLVFAALICKNLAVQAERKGIAIDYRYLCGAGWTPFFIWHMGLSGSAPLLVATADHFMVKEMGVIPISMTIFHPYNLILTAASIIAILVLFGFVLQPAQRDHRLHLPGQVDVEVGYSEHPCLRIG